MRPGDENKNLKHMLPIFFGMMMLFRFRYCRHCLSYLMAVRRGQRFKVHAREDLDAVPIADVITMTAFSPQLFLRPKFWSGVGCESLFINLFTYFFTDFKEEPS